MREFPTPGDDVALFIDWENFKISLAAGHRHPNVSALKEEAANHGRVVIARAYADWVTRAPELRGASQFINDPPALYAAGIEPVYVPTRLALATPPGMPGRTGRVKNSVDVKMTADCIECAHSYPNIGTFILVSGDSDFIHVVNALRTMGKRVLVIGVSWSTSRRLADQVDALILYDRDVDPITAPEVITEEVPDAIPTENGREPARTGSSTRMDLSEIIRAIEEIVKDERQAGGTPLLTSIKQRLMRRFPEFDEKRVGYSGFKKLMHRVAQEGNIKLITAGLVDWAIMASEETPEGSSDVKPRSRFSIGRRRKSQSTEPDVEPEESPSDDDSERPEVAAVAEDVQKDSEPETIPAVAAEKAEQRSLAEVMAGLDLPPGPDDGQNFQRAADLIIMADTLEHDAGASRMAFNFLVGEVSKALDEGLKAEQEEIATRWGQSASRTYISRMFRTMGNGELFRHGWHSYKDETSGHSRRRRTFSLDHSNAVVAHVLHARWNQRQDGEEALPHSAEYALEEPPAVEEPPDGAEKNGTSVFSRLFRRS